MKTIAVVIADDHPIIRTAFKNTFRKNENLKFLGEASNGIELLELVKEQVPDIAVIDLEMPRMDGYDTILELHTLYPEIKTVVFSGFLNAANQQRAINMGAHSSISKAESNKMIIQAIETIIRGERYHSKAFANFYVEPIEDKNSELLTLREKQILSLIADGKTSKQIGEVYSISQWTVDKHRSNIRGKLGLKNLSQMVRYAIEQGYTNQKIE